MAEGGKKVDGVEDTESICDRSHLRSQNKLDFDAPDLALMWKRWREEIELYIASALADRS